MNKFFEWVKRNPILAGAIIFIVGVIVIFVIFSGGSNQEPQQSQAIQSAPDGTQLALAQLSANSDMARVNAGASIGAAQIAADLQLGLNSNSMQYNSMYLQTELAKFQTISSERTNNMMLTLQEQIAANQNKTTVQLADISRLGQSDYLTAVTTQQKDMLNSMTQNAYINADITKTFINTSAAKDIAITNRQADRDQIDYKLKTQDQTLAGYKMQFDNLQANNDMVLKNQENNNLATLQGYLYQFMNLQNNTNARVATTPATTVTRS